MPNSFLYSASVSRYCALKVPAIVGAAVIVTQVVIVVVPVLPVVVVVAEEEIKHFF